MLLVRGVLSNVNLIRAEGGGASEAGTNVDELRLKTERQRQRGEWMNKDEATDAKSYESGPVGSGDVSLLQP